MELLKHYVYSVIIQHEDMGHLYIKVPNATCDLKVA